MARNDNQNGHYYISCMADKLKLNQVHELMKAFLGAVNQCIGADGTANIKIGSDVFVLGPKPLDLKTILYHAMAEGAFKNEQPSNQPKQSIKIEFTEPSTPTIDGDNQFLFNIKEYQHGLAPHSLPKDMSKDVRPKHLISCIFPKTFDPEDFPEIKELSDKMQRLRDANSAMPPGASMTRML